MSEIVYLNGNLVSTEQAAITPSDQGFLYGAGLFETMRAYEDRIFMLDRHLERLTSSAHVFGLENLENARLKEACLSVITANRLRNARVRLTVTFGSSPFPSISGPPTILAQAQPYQPPSAEKYLTGYRVMVSGQPRYSRSLILRHKTTCYLDCLLSRKKAVSEGNDEAIFVNETGNLTESSTGNLFMVGLDGTLVTPPIEAGLLPGITRRFILETAEKIGIRTIERNVGLADLQNFNGAFITNSLIEALPVASIKTSDGTEYSFNYRDVTRKLQKAYIEAVRREIGNNNEGHE